MRKYQLLSIALALLVVVSPRLSADEAVWTRVEETQFHMGTSFQIAVYARDKSAARKAIERAFQRIAELNQILSDYDPDSELSRLSKSSPTPEPAAVSCDLLHVLQTSQEVSRHTSGAFDVTVGPLTRLWRRARRQKRLPTQERLQAALDAVGYRWLEVDSATQSVALRRPDMRLDLGGIAKGYALDEALRVLEDAGIARALINGGGDLLLSDPPPEQSGWLIGIAPLEPSREEPREVRLSNVAVATSGDTYQFVELEGVRYSHIVNPHTGLGVTQRKAVTVIAKTGMTADAYASALSVLDAEPGLRLLREVPGAEARIIWQEGDRRRQQQTTAFPK
jgi:thiamine biosynthesis lipoprotein